MSTPGQRAYEKELEYAPNYHDGMRRKTWGQLRATEKATWERDPTPRKLKVLTTKLRKEPKT